MRAVDSWHEDAQAFRALSETLLRRYLLHDLLWCEPCGQPKVPIVLGQLSRYYSCTDRRCPHPPLPARTTEHRVWHRYVHLGGTAAYGMSAQRRRDVLREGIQRVVVGPGLMQLRLELSRSSDPR